MALDLDLVAALTLLLLIANGAPILARNALGRRFQSPVDLGARLADGRPLLGGDKTWRGMIAAAVATAAAAWLLGWSPWLGAAFGAASMLGDLASSFVKRRLGLAPGDSAPGLDQVPEALLPLLLLGGAVGVGLAEAAVVVIAFTALELAVSPLLFRLGVRRRPR